MTAEPFSVMSTITTAYDSGQREAFVAEVDRLLYRKNI
jgi:hypothetical protein